MITMVQQRLETVIVMSANGSKAGTDADGSGSEMDDNDDSSIMGVGAGMTGDATRTGTGRAFGAAGTGVGTNTFSESTAAMGELLFLSDGKAQPNVPIFNKSAIGSQDLVLVRQQSIPLFLLRIRSSALTSVVHRSRSDDAPPHELSYEIQPDQIISGNRLWLSH